MCGVANAPSATECIACGEVLRKTEKSLGEPESIRVGQVLSRSWELFWQFPGICLLGPLLANILTACITGLLAGLLVLALIGLTPVMQQNPALLMLSLALLGLIALIILLFAVAYFELGKTILFLRIARDEQPGVGDLFKGRPFTGRMVLCSLVFQVLVSFANLMIPLLGAVITLLFWPYPFLLVDRDLPGVESFSRAIDVTKGNLLTLFLVFFLLFGLAFLGGMALLGGAFLAVDLLNAPVEPVLGGLVMVGFPGGLLFYSYLSLVKAVAYMQITSSR